jgi:hypothetical protein
MNKKVTILGAIFICVAIVLAIPLYTKSKLSAEIQNAKEKLQTYGIKVKDVETSGYFTSKVQLKYVIEDGTKLQSIIIRKLQKIDPSFQTFFPPSPKTNKMLHEIFDGMSFEGTLSVSNLFLFDPHLVLSLTSFSDELMKEIKRDKEAKDFVLPLLANQTVTFIIDYDKQKRIKSFRIKDIKLQKEKQFNVQLLDNVLKLNYSKGISGTYTLGKQVYDIASVRKPFHLDVGKLFYSFDYLDQFNSKADVSINDTHLKSTKYGRTSEFWVKLTQIKSAVMIKNDVNLAASTSYEVKDIKFQDGRANFTLKDTKFSVDVENLMKDNVQALSNAYRNLMMQTDRYARRVAGKDLAKALEDLMHNGFNMKVAFSLEDASVKKLALKDIQGNFEVKIPKNNMNLKRQRFSAFLTMIDLSGKISMHEQDAQTIKKFSPRFSKVIDLGLQQADKKVYNIDYQNNHIYVNNTKL